MLFLEGGICTCHVRLWGGAPLEEGSARTRYGERGERSKGLPCVRSCPPGSHTDSFVLGPF